MIDVTNAMTRDALAVSSVSVRRKRRIANATRAGKKINVERNGKLLILLHPYPGDHAD